MPMAKPIGICDDCSFYPPRCKKICQTTARHPQSAQKITKQPTPIDQITLSMAPVISQPIMRATRRIKFSAMYIEASAKLKI
jgi:hypothetical protein